MMRSTTYGSETCNAVGVIMPRPMIMQHCISTWRSRSCRASARPRLSDLRRLAAELRSLRASSGLTRETVVERTGINAATLYRIEHGRVRPQTRTLRTLLDLYGVDQEQQAELVACYATHGSEAGCTPSSRSCRSTTRPTSASRAKPTACGTTNPCSCPGLLQTEDYARAVIRGGLPNASRDEVERRVEVRMERQALLRNDSPLNLWSIVDEAALRREVGGEKSCRRSSGTSWRHRSFRTSRSR